MIAGRHTGRLFNYTVFNNIRRDSRDVVLRLAYLGLQMIDLAMTLFAANLGFPELNPMINASLSSPLQLVLFKVGIPLMIVLFIPGKLLIPAIVLLAAVVGWNIKELLLI